MEEMKIKLDQKKSVVITPAVTKDIEEVTVVRIVDLPLEKRVRAFVLELERPFDLPQLSGDNYGDWKDTDVSSALSEELDKL
jgi:hypothetical protein